MANFYLELSSHVYYLSFTLEGEYTRYGIQVEIENYLLQEIGCHT